MKNLILLLSFLFSLAAYSQQRHPVVEDLFARRPLYQGELSLVKRLGAPDFAATPQGNFYLFKKETYFFSRHISIAQKDGLITVTYTIFYDGQMEGFKDLILEDIHKAIAATRAESGYLGFSPAVSVEDEEFVAEIEIKQLVEGANALTLLNFLRY